jgi:hypothetical protein
MFLLTLRKCCIATARMVFYLHAVRSPFRLSSQNKSLDGDFAFYKLQIGNKKSRLDIKQLFLLQVPNRPDNLFAYRTPCPHYFNLIYLALGRV